MERKKKNHIILHITLEYNKIDEGLTLFSCQQGIRHVVYHDRGLTGMEPEMFKIAHKFEKGGA